MDDLRTSWGYDWLSSPATDDIDRLRKEIVVAADTYGRLVEKDLALPLPEAAGQEHDVYVITQGVWAGRIVKISKDDTPGVILKLSHPWDKQTQQHIPVITLRKSFPSEYAQRIHRQNAIFKDETVIHGVIVGDEEIRFVSSQPFRTGNHPTQKEVAGMMREMGFSHVASLAIQNKYLSEFSYFHAEDNLLVSDAKSSNFIKQDGVIRPIDIICQRPDIKFREFLLVHLD